jgi:hypothetical protein
MATAVFGTLGHSIIRQSRIMKTPPLLLICPVLIRCCLCIPKTLSELMT